MNASRRLLEHSWSGCRKATVREIAITWTAFTTGPLFTMASSSYSHRLGSAAPRRARMECLESRHLMSAIPLGATPQDTAEFMLGRVAVVPVLFESNGVIDANTQNWTPEEIDAAIEKVRTGVQWWADTLDTLGTVHTLEFVIDESFAKNPFPTPYEPIDRRSQDSPIYITPFLRAQGIEEATSLEDAVRQFNHAARLKHNTDWAFTIFLIDSSDDPDGQFAPGSEFSIAHAFPGGLYIVSPSTRPASTITHETGHIFWARDEYPGGGSWTDRRGYYNAQNLNAADNSTPGFVQEVSIMRAGSVLNESYNTRYLPASTRAMIGWLDSNGNGIFDVADVPLHLEGDGRYDLSKGVFTFDGNVSAVPLPNRNSSGPQNDITLNRVDRIEYRIDGGQWFTAIEVNAQSADVSFELSIAPFNTIELRGIDDAVGVTSPILQTSGSLPILSGSSIGGFAFIDASGEGESDPSQTLFSSVTAVLAMADGSPLLGGSIQPSALPIGPLEEPITGTSLTASGVILDGRVGIYTAPGASQGPTFHYYNLQNALWQNAWGPFRKFVASFDQTVGEVSLDAIGISGAGSFARLEAYDAAGELLTRITTGSLTPGQRETMTVADANGRIASIRAFGHQSSEVALDSLLFGTKTTAVTGTDGVFQFTGIPDGDYRLSLSPERLIYHFAGSGSTITVSGGISAPVTAGFQRVASPWRNPTDRFDVDGNGRVEPLDALRIINEISRNGARILTDPSQVTQYFDPSDDGAISALDALRVINEVARRGRANGDSAGIASEGEFATLDSVLAGWNPTTKKEKGLNAHQVLEFSGEPFALSRF